MIATGTKGLLVWCKQITKNYGEDVEVKNMTTSFRNGMAFCAILHHYRPDLIDFNKLSKENVAENNALAFRIAEEELDIPALLDVEDMVSMKVPDRLSIMTYVSQYYNYFKDKVPGEIEKKRFPTKKRQNADRNVSQSPPAKKGVETLGTKQSEASSKTRGANCCCLCGKQVFLMERMTVESKLFHRVCFKCCVCDAQLKTSTYEYDGRSGLFYCSKDFKERAKTRKQPIGKDASPKSTNQTSPRSPTTVTNNNQSIKSVIEDSPFKRNEQFFRKGIKPQSSTADITWEKPHVIKSKTEEHRPTSPSSQTGKQKGKMFLTNLMKKKSKDNLKKESPDYSNPAYQQHLELSNYMNETDPKSPVTSPDHRVVVGQETTESYSEKNATLSGVQIALGHPIKKFTGSVEPDITSSEASGKTKKKKLVLKAKKKKGKEKDVVDSKNVSGENSNETVSSPNKKPVEYENLNKLSEVMNAVSDNTTNNTNDPKQNDRETGSHDLVVESVDSSNNTSMTADHVRRPRGLSKTISYEEKEPPDSSYLSIRSNLKKVDNGGTDNRRETAEKRKDSAGDTYLDMRSKLRKSNLSLGAGKEKKEAKKQERFSAEEESLRDIRNSLNLTENSSTEVSNRKVEIDRNEKDIRNLRSSLGSTEMIPATENILTNKTAEIEPTATREQESAEETDGGHKNTEIKEEANEEEQQINKDGEVIDTLQKNEDGNPFSSDTEGESDEEEPMNVDDELSTAEDIVDKPAGHVMDGSKVKQGGELDIHEIENEIQEFESDVADNSSSDNAAKLSLKVEVNLPLSKTYSKRNVTSDHKPDVNMDISTDREGSEKSNIKKISVDAEVKTNKNDVMAIGNVVTGANDLQNVATEEDKNNNEKHSAEIEPTEATESLNPFDISDEGGSEEGVTNIAHKSKEEMKIDRSNPFFSSCEDLLFEEEKVDEFDASNPFAEDARLERDTRNNPPSFERNSSSHLSQKDLQHLQKIGVEESNPFAEDLLDESDNDETSHAQKETNKKNLVLKTKQGRKLKKRIAPKAPSAPSHASQPSGTPSTLTSQSSTSKTARKKRAAPKPPQLPPSTETGMKPAPNSPAPPKPPRRDSSRNYYTDDPILYANVKIQPQNIVEHNEVSPGEKIDEVQNGNAIDNKSGIDTFDSSIQSQQLQERNDSETIFNSSTTTTATTASNDSPLQQTSTSDESYKTFENVTEHNHQPLNENESIEEHNDTPGHDDEHSLNENDVMDNQRVQTNDISGKIRVDKPMQTTDETDENRVDEPTESSDESDKNRVDEPVQTTDENDENRVEKPTESTDESDKNGVDEPVLTTDENDENRVEKPTESSDESDKNGVDEPVLTTDENDENRVEKPTESSDESDKNGVDEPVLTTNENDENRVEKPTESSDESDKNGVDEPVQTTDENDRNRNTDHSETHINGGDFVEVNDLDKISKPEFRRQPSGKRKAPARPKPPVTKTTSLNDHEMSENIALRDKQPKREEIEQELKIIEIKQRELEREGVAMEKKLRECTEGEPEDAYLLTWFELVNQKNQLLRRENELIYMSQELDFLQNQRQTEFELRQLMMKSEDEKTEADREREEELLAHILELVTMRSNIVDKMDEERIRECEEDEEVRSMMEMQGLKSPEKQQNKANNNNNHKKGKPKKKEKKKDKKEQKKDQKKKK